MVKFMLGWLSVAALSISAFLAYMMWMPGSSYRGALPEPDDDQRQLAAKLNRHVRVLAEEIGPRSVLRRAALEEAASHIEQTFVENGYAVRRLPVAMPPGVGDTWNVEAIKEGERAGGPVVIVGAHYDSVGFSCPGANDNASGVAAMLVIAEALKSRRLSLPVRFVAFVNEEPPYFQTAQMGSAVYASELAKSGTAVEAMLSLETIGYYSEQHGSQSYPFPLSLAYPAKGNFIGFVGSLSHASLVRRAIGAFRKAAKFPSEGIAAPTSLPGVSWSDQWAFWEQGYPALMVTDTAPFRYPHYHLDSDTWDKLDYESMSRVTSGLIEVVAHLAG